MIRFAVLWVWLAFLPQDSWDEKAALSVVADYFKDGADRPALLEKLEGYDAIPAARIKKIVDSILKRVREGSRSKPDAQGLCTLQHPTEKGTYFLSGADGKSKAPQPMVIALHGGSPGLEGNKDMPLASGKEAMRAWNPAGTPLAKAIVIGPNQPPEKPRAWTHDGGMRFVIACIEEVCRTYNVDTSRIYCVGHSLGGFGAWNIGSLAPDIFAAVAGGGCVPVGCIENLRDLPCWQYWGPDDPHREYQGFFDQYTKKVTELRAKHGGFDHVLKSYAGIGHGFPPEGHGPIFQWLATKKRDMPRRILWKPVAGRRGCHWLWGATQGVVAEQSKNEFEISGACTLFLNEQVVDLKKPVVVRREGQEVHRGIVAPSLVAIVLSLEEWGDPSRVFTARVRLP